MQQNSYRGVWNNSSQSAFAKRKQVRHDFPASPNDGFELDSTLSVVCLALHPYVGVSLLPAATWMCSRHPIALAILFEAQASRKPPQSCSCRPRFSLWAQSGGEKPRDVKKPKVKRCITSSSGEETRKLAKLQGSTYLVKLLPSHEFGPAQHEVSD